MGFQIREMAPNELDLLIGVVQVVYARGEPVDRAKPFLKENERGFLAFDAGRLVGSYQVNDYAVTRGSCDVRCAGIGSVGVLPEFRSAGIGAKMMGWSLRDLKERGFHLACLYAYREKFYRKFGYEVAGRRWLIKCPQHRFPRTDGGLDARQISLDEITKLDEAYVPFARRLSGANLRSPSDWLNRMGKRPPIIYAVGNPIEAYAWSHMDGGFWEPLKIGELVWRTQAGYDSLMGLLGGLLVNRSEMVWHEPSNSPFLSLYMDQGVSVSLDRQAMFRVLDVPKALERLRCSAEGEFTIEVADEQLPENRGPWRVRFSPRQTEVLRATSAEISCGIGAFSQAFLGEPSFRKLAGLGLIKLSDERQLIAASSLMHSMPAMCTEFF